MWPFSSCAEADACAATPPNAITLSIIISSLPFIAVFATIYILSLRHIFPRLSKHSSHGQDHTLPLSAPAALRQAHAEHGAKSFSYRTVKLAFGSTLGLSATLGTLILAEILEVVDPRARALALKITVPGLLFLVVGVVPWLECRSLVRAFGWSFQRSAKGRAPIGAWVAHVIVFACWLFVFWCVGETMSSAEATTTTNNNNNVKNKGSYNSRGVDDSLGERMTRACLERVGVVGICLMALLAGFASVSSPWHTFSGAVAHRRRPITEMDVSRKQAGLDATNEMLVTKRHRLQMLQQRALDQQDQHHHHGRPNGGFMGRVMGSFRGVSADETEMRTLRVEIAGLETMQANLSSNLSVLKSQRSAAILASSPLGRLLLLTNYAFSAYCVYRILATALTTLSRVLSPSSSSFSSRDPINRFLSLAARHWNPHLDQEAWSRSISFGLSGVMLLLSVNSVVTTLRLFGKWIPPVVRRHAEASLALGSAQVAATYTLSSALLLRSQLPGKVSSAVGGALARGGAPPLMSTRFADGWFEGWFLVGGCVTAVGIWVARSINGAGGGGEFNDEYDLEEEGTKRS